MMRECDHIMSTSEFLRRADSLACFVGLGMHQITLQNKSLPHTALWGLAFWQKVSVKWTRYLPKWHCLINHRPNMDTQGLGYSSAHTHRQTPFFSKDFGQLVSPDCRVRWLSPINLSRSTEEDYQFVKNKSVGPAHCTSVVCGAVWWN
jgi:hypothetical protein